MKFRSLTSLLMAGMTMSQAFALPDPKAQISDLTAKISLDGIGPIMGDHEKRDVLYVSPGDMKVIGQYVATGVVGNCNDLIDLHGNLNAMPDRKDAQKIYNENRYYSALFSITAQNIRQSEDAQKISELKDEYNNLRKDNKHLLGEYESSYQEVESVKSDLENERAVQKTLQTNLFSELATATSDAERTAIRDGYREKNREIMARIVALEHQKRQSQARFNNALRDWAPFKNQLEYIAKIEENYAVSHANNMKERRTFYEDTKKYFEELSAKVVGKATAGYSLNGKEKRDLLLKRLNEAGLQYSVQPLQIFNVSINQKLSEGARIETTDSEETTTIGDEENRSDQQTFGDSNETLATNTEIEVDGEKRKLTWEVKSFSNTAGASGAVDIPVTRGGVCGSEEMVTKIYTVQNDQGEKVERKVTYPQYVRASQVVMSKNLPLTFNYYQKAEPLSGVCTMDVDQGSSYVRNHGKKKSGGFFNRKSKSWDHTRVEMKNDMGLACELTKSPAGANPEESEMINTAFEKALYQDVFHMFIMAYGKSYTVVPVPKTELGQDSRFFSQIGSGVMNLCGEKNKFCELSGIVLKSMGELVGSHHSGSSSHTTSSRGTIKKNFKLSTYLISQGSANVELKVCLDQKNCN